jgi:uracil-DNA glycosylase
LLRGAIAELGWPGTALYLTNAVKHFHHELRGKRRIHKTPGQREADACLHWLESEIEAVRPRAIVALGASAARSLLGNHVAITANAGRWLARPDGTRVLVCLHPAAILRADPDRQDASRSQWIASLRQASGYVTGDIEGHAGEDAQARAAA